MSATRSRSEGAVKIPNRGTRETGMQVGSSRVRGWRLSRGHRILGKGRTFLSVGRSGGEQKTVSTVEPWDTKYWPGQKR